MAEMILLATHPDGTTDVVIEPEQQCMRCRRFTSLGAIKMMTLGNVFRCWPCSDASASEPPAGRK